MKKIFLIMFCMVLLVGTISAGELLSFDNVKQYDEGTKTITIVNTFGLGRDISTIQLNTPLNVMVSTGYQKVAEFEIDLFDDTYSSAFDKMEFYNKKNMDRIDREFDYKYLAIELVDVNDYKESCSTSGNGTKVCEQVIIGTHQKEKEVWEDLDTSILTKGKVTIGIFTNVQVGDYVEWIPTLFGKEIDEWATWTASLNVGLVSWYKLDETTGVVLDELYVNNGTNYNATRGVTGISGSAFNFNSSNLGVYYGTSSSLSIAGNLSISAWVKPNQGSSNIRGVFIDWSGSNKNYIFWIEGNGSIQFSNGNGLTNQKDLHSDAIPDDGEWHHVVATRDTSGNNASIYIDGTLNMSFSLTLDGGATSNNVSLGFWAPNNGQFMEGLIDEVGVWNRTLTNEEAIVLYNNGLGCTLGLCEYTGLNVTLNTPVDSADFIIKSVNFGGIVSDDINLINVSLIINDVYNETNTSGINNSNYTFTKTFTDGDYTWTYEACDSDSQCLNGTARTFNVNTTSFIKFEDPTPVNEYNSTTSYVPINVSLTETYFKNITFSFYNNTLTEFYHTDTTRFINESLADGIYSYNVTVWTTTDQSNSTATRNITIDTTKPAVIILAPLTTIDHHLINTNLSVNWSANDTHLDTCILQFEGVNRTVTCSDNQTQINITNTINRSIIFYVNDTFGHMNSTIRSWDYTIFENSQTFNDGTLEGTIETFTANVTIEESSSIAIA